MNDTLFDKAFIKVKLLSTIFRTNENRYLSPAYQEAEVRKDFIDKFFTALGWDVNHDEQTDPYAQEVKVERGVETRTVDYAFFLKPNFRDTHFLVEAKKPSRNIENPDFYFQTIRYGYNANCPVCVLTDFEQFHILDCRHKPDIDSALSRCLEKFTYSDYADRDKFARIYWLFSREAVAGGSLSKFSESLPKPRGKARQRGLLPSGFKPVDESLLEELDEFRVALAKIFKAGNPNLDSETLTELAHRVIDRLVFMRFLEDKVIEPQPIIDKFGRGGEPWHDFNSACRRLDGIYNGIVFKQHGILDAPGFRVNNDEFSKIIKEISRTNSPYDFNSIPIHILGSIYERFLGKVIVATDKRVRIEDKPEVRKAGGVYYTPEYIVRYIVENTVGKLIAGKTPEQIAGMRFADIACGSGSFLLGVYDLLLQYHGNYYNANPKKAKKGDCIERDGKLYLSLGKKREILLNNIYGVDIDAQAVEVCQLSLYLKLLAEETTATAHQYLLDFERQALLPTLTKNIICGNSLIGTDILEGKLFAGDEEKKLNPMNFENAFPEIMKGGGFDAILGNPPYILLQILEQPCVFKYISSSYRAARYKIDTYHVFLERALTLTQNSGYVGYITPNTFLRNKHAYELRRLILEKSEIQVLRLFFYKVFHGASVDTSILLIQKSENPDANHRVEVVCSRNPFPPDDIQYQLQRVWRDHPENQFSLPGLVGSEELENKIREHSALLGEFATAYFGIQTFDRDKYVKSRRTAAYLKPVIDGVHINRYELARGNEFVDFRPSAIKSGGNMQVYEQPRVGVRQIGRTPVATYLPSGLYTLNTIYNIFITKPTSYELKFLLGIICSKALGWYWFRAFYDQKETFPKIKKDALLSIAIPRINFSDPADKQKHDEIVAKVEAMLEAKKQLADAKTDKDKNYYEAKCSGLDRQIDRLVYELYGLTEEEIKIVEESVSR